jgi:hypothetical protein
VLGGLWIVDSMVIQLHTWWRLRGIAIIDRTWVICACARKSLFRLFVG